MIAQGVPADSSHGQLISKGAPFLDRMPLALKCEQVYFDAAPGKLVQIGNHLGPHERLGNIVIADVKSFWLH